MSLRILKAILLHCTTLISIVVNCFEFFWYFSIDMDDSSKNNIINGFLMKRLITMIKRLNIDSNVYHQQNNTG